MRIDKLFGLSSLTQPDVRIEFWNVSNITFDDNIPYREAPSHIVYKKIVDFNDFDKSIVENNNKDTIYLPYFQYEKRTFWVYRTLSKHNCLLLCTIVGRQPTVHNINLSKSTFNYKRLRNSLIHRFLLFIKSTPLIHKSDYCFISGKPEIDAGRVVGKNTKFYPFNTFDYQDSLVIDKNVLFKDKQKMAVFIDQYIPFHPDRLNAGYDVSADQYFDELNKAFDLIEMKYNCKVVIAAHPAAMEYRNKNYFHNREIFYGKTKDLVYNSDIVIAHQSTGMSFAIIYEKPIIIIINKQFHNLHIGQSCLYKQRVLNTNYIDFCSGKNDLPEILRIDTKCYKDYKYEYLTSIESEGKSNTELLLNLLKN